MSKAAACGGGMGGGDDWKRKEEVYFVLSSSEDEVEVNGDEETSALEKKSKNANSKGKRKLNDGLDMKELGKKKSRLGTNCDEGSASMAKQAAEHVTVETRKRGVNITFVGERTNESLSRNQNRLTRLGQNVEAWKTLPVVEMPSKTPDLGSHRMERLINAKVLRIRNHLDFEAVVYLIKYHRFHSTVEAPDKNIVQQVKTKLKDKKLYQGVKFTVREPFSSDDESYGSSDEENGSVDRFDSDYGLRAVKDESAVSKSHKGSYVDDLEGGITYLENKNEEEGSESDPDHNYGDGDHQDTDDTSTSGDEDRTDDDTSAEPDHF